MANNDNTTVITEGWKVHETAKAVLIRTIEGTDIWVPKSQIIQLEVNGTEIVEGGNVLEEIDVLIMLEWHAKSKGLI